MNNGILLDLTRQRQEEVARRADSIGPHVAELRANRPRPLLLRYLSKKKAERPAEVVPECTMEPKPTFC